MAKRSPKMPMETVAEVNARKRTGLFWACSANFIQGVHGDLGPVGTAIKIDRRGCFYIRCPSCGSQQFFSREYWTESHGLSADQAKGMGLTII